MIEYQGKQYPTREVNLSKWEGANYIVIVAPERLLKAMQPNDDIYYEWVEDTPETAIDDTLAGYVDDEVWDKDLSDKELSQWVHDNLYK